MISTVHIILPQNLDTRISLNYRRIVKAILFFAISIERTFTSTISPTETFSSGCLMYCSHICEIWTRPSWCTPISTKAPKSITLRIVPLSIIPSLKSSSDNTSERSAGLGESSLGSLPGFSSSFKISDNVSSPTESSDDNFF